MWFTGIDWADTHHDIVIIEESGKKLASFRVMHTASGLAELTSRLEAVCGSSNKATMACVIETNHGLLITRLLEAGFAVYPVNPKTVDRKRSASGAKTDKIDAYLLAKHGRSELSDLRRLSPDSPVIAELKTLTRDQDNLIRSQTRLVNQLTACRHPRTILLRSPSSAKCNNVRPCCSCKPFQLLKKPWLPRINRSQPC